MQKTHIICCAKKVIIWVRCCTCSHHSCLRKSGNYRYTWLIKTIPCPSACTLNHMNDIFFSCVVSSPLHLLMVCLTCIVGRVTILHLCELLFLSSSELVSLCNLTFISEINLGRRTEPCLCPARGMGIQKLRDLPMAGEGVWQSHKLNPAPQSPWSSQDSSLL